MTITNHYGKYVDSEVPVAGIFCLNMYPQFISDGDSDGIDLAYLEWEMDHDCETPDDCQCEPPMDMESATLIGDWKKDENGLYIPDTDGEYAIDATGETYGAVVFSKYTRRVALCSPCFPSCGDLDSEGKFLAYDLPPYAYEENE